MSGRKPKHLGYHLLLPRVCTSRQLELGTELDSSRHFKEVEYGQLGGNDIISASLTQRYQSLVLVHPVSSQVQKIFKGCVSVVLMAGRWLLGAENTRNGKQVAIPLSMLF